MNHTLAVIAGLAIAFFIVIGTYYIPEFFKRRKNRKLFNSVQVGDKYIQNLCQPDPFKSQWGNVITITDKTMNKDGIVYVKYLEGSFIERSGSLSYLIDVMDYEPYNNQDKKQQ